MTEPYNAAERTHVRQAAKVAKLVDRQRTEFITSIMSTVPGRGWVCDILESAHVFATSFSASPYSTAFAEGERNMGLRILNDVMGACPDQYVLMMRERNERRTATDSVRPAATSADSGGGDPTPDDGDGTDVDDIYAEERDISTQQRTG